MTSQQKFSITLETRNEKGFEFLVDFHQPGVLPLLMDEPAPLGSGSGPNASALLAAAVGNCLSASLMYCLEKSHVQVHGVKTRVTGQLTRNEKGRVRIEGLQVEIGIHVPTEGQAQLKRCEELFEDFCVVTQSVRDGIPVDVKLVHQ